MQKYQRVLIVSLITIFAVFPAFLNAQECLNEQRIAYVNKHRHDAGNAYGVPVPLMHAWAIIESQSKADDGNWYPGENFPATCGNNHFGRKCSRKNWRRLPDGSFACRFGSGHCTAVVCQTAVIDNGRPSSYKAYPCVSASYIGAIETALEMADEHNVCIPWHGSLEDWAQFLGDIPWAENSNYSNELLSLANDIICHFGENYWQTASR